MVLFENSKSISVKKGVPRDPVTEDPLPTCQIGLKVRISLKFHDVCFGQSNIFIWREQWFLQMRFLAPTSIWMQTMSLIKHLQKYSFLKHNIGIIGMNHCALHNEQKLVSIIFVTQHILLTSSISEFFFQVFLFIYFHPNCWNSWFG